MNLEQFKQELMKDLEFKKEYERFDLGMWLDNLYWKFKIWISQFKKQKRKN